MINEEAAKVTREQLHAFNEKDWEQWLDVSAEDCVYDEIATHSKLTGRDNVLVAMKAWANAFPNVQGAIDHLSTDGNKTTTQLTWKGKHTGPLHTPAGEIPPTGKEIEIRACQVTEIEDGKVKTMENYFDMMTMMNQLGLTN